MENVMGKALDGLEIFVGKTKGKRSLGRLKCRWLGNVEMD
jgi:hypothetical protein